MRINRTQNASRNILFGSISKIYEILLPFVIRTVFIHKMGAEYLGLNGLFSSIIQVLNLAELGVGSAMVYAMYKPIVEDDSKTICGLMKLYRKYYRIIGGAVLALGLAIIPILPVLVKNELPSDVNLYILYLMNLGATVLSYWLFAYKNCLLTAHQRDDIISKISIVIKTVTNLGFLAVLVFTQNYYLYLLVSLVTAAVSNILTAVIVTKKYPDYKPERELPKEIVKKINSSVRDLFTAKIGGKVVWSADTIVISSFLGLVVLGQYQNYYFILTQIIFFVLMVFAACVAGIGNSIVVETKEKNYRDFVKLNFIVTWISAFCISCFLTVFQPFIELWAGKEFLLDFKMVILFCGYFYVYIVDQLLSTYKDAAGAWYKDRFRPLVAALINLTLNIVMVKLGLGLYGVVLSTIIALGLFSNTWLIKNLFSEVFPGNMMKKYSLKLIKNSASVVFVSAITYFVCFAVGHMIKMSLLATVIVNIIICTVTANGLFLLLYFKTQDFSDFIEIVKKMFGSFLSRKSKEDLQKKAE